MKFETIAQTANTTSQTETYQKPPLKRKKLKKTKTKHNMQKHAHNAAKNSTQKT